FLLRMAQFAHSFWIHTGPEERKVANVSVDFSPRIANAMFGLHHHFGHFIDGATIESPHAIDAVAFDEANQQVRDVIDQWRINNTQLRFKSLLCQSGKEPVEHA